MCFWTLFFRKARRKSDQDREPSLIYFDYCKDYSADKPIQSRDRDMHLVPEDHDILYILNVCVDINGKYSGRKPPSLLQGGR